MQFIKPDINIDFLSKKWIAIGLSTLVNIAAILILVINGGPKMGIDFAGGTQVVVKFSQATNADAIRKTLDKVGLGTSSIQQFGLAEEKTFAIKGGESEADAATSEFGLKVDEALKKSYGANFEVIGKDAVGPQVGRDLWDKALNAMFYSMIFMLIYISGRFEMQWLPSAVMSAIILGTMYVLSLFGIHMYALMAIALVIAVVCFYFFKLRAAMGAIVGLLHDTLLTVGILALLGKEFNLQIVAAILTIIGYSVNDTIIVFDRVRENTTKYARMPLEAVINRSVNETLSRTVLTSGVTLLTVFAIFFLGGEVLHDFALAIIIGFIAGTYSSIFIACPFLLFWRGGNKAVGADMMAK
ncbi:MAG: protein translocase subunit SecF [Deltaproteobacteria bacterium]|nr:protein translocase subunit SecF [Deltaproteobacteria bacterium]